MGTAGRDCEPSGLRRAVWRESDLFGRERRAQPQDTHAVKGIWYIPSTLSTVPGLGDQRRESNAHDYRASIKELGPPRGALSPLKAQRG